MAFQQGAGMTAIVLRVEPAIGQNIQRVAEAMWALGARLQLEVVADFNGTELIARLGAKPDDIIRLYRLQFRQDI